MSRDIILSQTHCVALEGVREILRVITGVEYAFKDATLYLEHGEHIVGEKGSIEAIRVKGRVYPIGGNWLRFKSRLFVQLYPKGSPAPVLSVVHEHQLVIGGKNYRVMSTGLALVAIA